MHRLAALAVLVNTGAAGAQASVVASAADENWANGAEQKSAKRVTVVVINLIIDPNGSLESPMQHASPVLPPDRTRVVVIVPPSLSSSPDDAAAAMTENRDAHQTAVGRPEEASSPRRLHMQNEEETLKFLPAAGSASHFSESTEFEQPEPAARGTIITCVQQGFGAGNEVRETTSPRLYIERI